MSGNILLQIYENRQKSSILNKEYKKPKEDLENIMIAKDVKTITDRKNNLIANKKETIRETLPKKDIPVDIWNTYKKETISSVLSVKSIKQP